MVAIDNLDLEIEPGEFLVLLGPSGCGKTTTLRCIAGLETGEEGSIEIGDGTVFDASRGINVPPNKRNLGMVFQSYALWPHMTVRKNIGYPLKTRGIKGEKADQWIEEVAALVDTSALLDRYPAQLSGGQQQRVALSRGLVARPDIVLFDEPSVESRRATSRPCPHRDPRVAREDRLHRRCTSPTTRSKRSRWETASRSCARGRSSNSQRQSRYSRSPPPITSRGSSGWGIGWSSNAGMDAGHTTACRSKASSIDTDAETIGIRTRSEDVDLAAILRVRRPTTR